jgi:hypothetical protein
MRGCIRTHSPGVLDLINESWRSRSCSAAVSSRESLALVSSKVLNGSLYGARVLSFQLIGDSELESLSRPSCCNIIDDVHSSQIDEGLRDRHNRLPHFIQQAKQDIDLEGFQGLPLVD